MSFVQLYTKAPNCETPGVKQKQPVQFESANVYVLWFGQVHNKTQWAG